jgi:transcriptional regulator with XRE-family HTH domain
MRHREKTLGENIQSARKAVGLTQKELAEKIGVVHRTVQQYELNKREPRLETLGEIANVLNTSVLALIPESYWGTIPEDKFQDSLDEAFGSTANDHSIARVIARELRHKAQQAKTTLSCRIDSAVYEALAEIAKNENRTVEDEVNEALAMFVEEELAHEDELSPPYREI